nr:hypothetical protein [uncultured Pseudomonas sp.]
MGRQYRLSGERPAVELFERIASALSASGCYQRVASQAHCAGFVHTGTDVAWGVDIEVSVDPEGVLLQVHAGNARQLIGLIQAGLGTVGRSFAVHEL